MLSYIHYCVSVILWYSDMHKHIIYTKRRFVLQLFYILPLDFILWIKFIFSARIILQPTTVMSVVSATQITINKLYFDIFIAEIVFHFISFHSVIFCSFILILQFIWVWTSYCNHLAKCQFQFKMYGKLSSTVVGRRKWVHLLEIPTNYHRNHMLLLSILI